MIVTVSWDIATEIIVVLKAGVLTHRVFLNMLNICTESLYQGTITQLIKTHSKVMTFIMPNRQTNWKIRNYYINILIQQKESHITQSPMPDSP